MLLLSLTKEPCLLEVMDDALVVPTVVQVVGRSVTKLARQGCELVEELPELRMMYSYRVFTAHLHAVLEGMNSFLLACCLFRWVYTRDAAMLTG